MKIVLKSFRNDQSTVKKIILNNIDIQLLKRLICKLIVPLSFFFILYSCASTSDRDYFPSQQFVSEEVYGFRRELYNMSKQVLIVKGYKIMSADDVSLTIITAPKEMRLNESYADCGMLEGTNLIGDIRTLSSVSFEIKIDDNRISIRTTIQAVYLKRSANPVDLNCVSTGKLEREILQAIRLQS